MKNNNNYLFMKKFEILIILLSILEILFFFIFFSFFIEPVNSYSNQTVRIITQLDVGNVYPEVLNVSLDNGAATITLIPNLTKLVECVALLRDYNNDTDIANVTAEFYHTTDSNYSGSRDNNYHYSNNSCTINRSFGTWLGMVDDTYMALANCTFNVWYYANWSNWNCTVFVNDSVGWNATGNDSISINQLLAIGLPDNIHYGTVDATYVSNENATNVTNAGNVRLNISVTGYARTEGDNLAMNCTKGSNKTIPIGYQRYNLTTSTAGALTLAQFDATYLNLTQTAVVKKFNLNSRFDDNIDDAFNATYWRIYVPVGVAGTCQGNILIGATIAQGS